MSSPAERDWFQRRIWIVACGVVVLWMLEIFLLGPAQRKSLSWALAAESLAAILPNFIAGLVAAFVVYFFVREGDRTNYVRAMRGVRSSALSLLNEGKLKENDVRALMRAFVPAVSQLYFRTEQPPVRRQDLNLEFTKTTCFSCRQVSEVRAGRCTECHDILDSWKAVERKSDHAAKAT